MNHSRPTRIPTPPPASAKTDAAAAGWVARHDAGLNAEEERQFQQWLAADARHASAWREIAAAWRSFDGPRHRGDAGRMIRELTVRRRRRRRRRMLIGSAVLAVFAMAAVVMISQSRLPVATRAVETVAVSRPERRQLADGSVVELNAGAEIDVHFSALRRDVTLKRGEAHFAVAKDAARPFVVATNFGEARAVGTAFSVGLGPTSMAILVTEGTVAVRQPAASAHEPTAVPAGNAVVVRATSDVVLRLESVAPAEIERRLAWRAPHLQLANTTLADVVAAFNREGRVQLTVPDAALARLRFTGVFRADRPEEFVRVLEAHYGVQAERQGANMIVLRLRQ